MTSRICHWHRCARRFELDGAHAIQTQLYCTRDCRQRHRQWTIARGAPMVEALLLIDRTRRLNDQQRRDMLFRLQREKGVNVPGLVDGAVPTLTDVWRVVRSWRVEMLQNEGAERQEGPTDAG